MPVVAVRSLDRARQRERYAAAGAAVDHARDIAAEEHQVAAATRVRRERDRQRRSIRYVTIEGHLAYAQRRLTAALREAHDVGFNEEEMELLRDSISKVWGVFDPYPPAHGGDTGHRLGRRAGQPGRAAMSPARKQRRDDLFDLLVANPTGVTVDDMMDLYGWTHGEANNAIRDLRQFLGTTDNINLPCDPQGKGERWLYRLVGTLDDVRGWNEQPDR